MTLVQNVDDIVHNLKTMRGYLFGRNRDDREDARQLLGQGKNFVAGSLRGQVTFGPSRFMEYTENYLERHLNRLPSSHPDAFRRGRPDGGETTRAIDGVLARITRGKPDWERLENFYLKYCKDWRATPRNYVKSDRTYWNLDELNFEHADPDVTYFEGRRISAVTMRSERSADARARCI